MVSLLPALLIALSGPPVTHVAVQHDGPGARALREQVALRILDAGYALGPDGGPGDARVVLGESEDMAQVLVTHAGQERRHTLRQAEASVRSLEMAHRAIESLEELVGTGEGSEVQGPRVALILDGLVPSRGRIATTLLDESFIVVPADAPASWRICVRERDGGFQVARSRNLDCEASGDQPVMPGRDVPRAVRGQARAIRGEGRVPRAETPDVDRPGPSPTLERSHRAGPMRRKAPAIFRAAADGGILARGAGVEGVATARLDAGRTTGVAGGLRCSFVPSTGRDHRALDTLLSAGLIFRARFRNRGEAGAGLLGGVLFHRMNFTGQPVARSLDPNLVFPVHAAVTSRRGIGVTVSLNQGFTVRAREYRVDGETVWMRRAYRVGLSVGIHYDREIG